MWNGMQAESQILFLFLTSSRGHRDNVLALLPGTLSFANRPAEFCEAPQNVMTCAKLTGPNLAD